MPLGQEDSWGFGASAESPCIAATILAAAESGGVEGSAALRARRPVEKRAACGVEDDRGDAMVGLARRRVELNPVARRRHVRQIMVSSAGGRGLARIWRGGSEWTVIIRNFEIGKVAKVEARDVQGSGAKNFYGRADRPLAQF